jgi:hypothetical protein
LVTFAHDFSRGDWRSSKTRLANLLGDTRPGLARLVFRAVRPAISRDRLPPCVFCSDQTLPVGPNGEHGPHSVHDAVLRFRTAVADAVLGEVIPWALQQAEGADEYGLAEVLFAELCGYEPAPRPTG